MFTEASQGAGSVHPGTRHLRLILVGGSLALLAACGDQPETQQFYVEPEPQDNPTAQTQAAAEAVADREALPETSPVLSVGGSGASGNLTTTTSADRLQLTIRVEGLPDAPEFPAHVHRGVCAEGGPVAVALSAVVPGMPGSGTSTTALEAGELPADEPFFVQVHGPSGAPIACGDIVESGS